MINMKHSNTQSQSRLQKMTQVKVKAVKFETQPTANEKMIDLIENGAEGNGVESDGQTGNRVLEEIL